MPAWWRHQGPLSLEGIVKRQREPDAFGFLLLHRHNGHSMPPGIQHRSPAVAVVDSRIDLQVADIQQHAAGVADRPNMERAFETHGSPRNHHRVTRREFAGAGDHQGGPLERGFDQRQIELFVCCHDMCLALGTVGQFERHYSVATARLHAVTASFTQQTSELVDITGSERQA